MATTSADDTYTSVAWPLFDQVIAEAKERNGGTYSNPWVADVAGVPRFRVDDETLTRLLGVPLVVRGAASTSGILALALDVWAAYELRRAGFEPEAIWPRETAPRVLPVAVGNLLKSTTLTVDLKKQLAARINGRSSVQGVASAEAKVLGKLYEKQIDAGMSRWETGPEVLISTKRMDRSFGKNLANRVEEGYGDAKNLRLRYPMAAIGFVFGLRSTVLTERREGARAVIDRLTKLEAEDDAYDATCLVMLEYTDPATWPERPTLADLPDVRIRWDAMPGHIDPNAFFTKIVGRVLEVTPESFHAAARDRLAAVLPEDLPEH